MKLYPIALEVDPLDASPLPVDLTLIKTYCSVDFDDQDELIEASLLSAVKAFEDSTHRTVFARTHRWTLWDFPQDTYQKIRLPRGKVQSVEKVEAVVNGQTVTLTGPSSGSPAGDDYQEDLRSDDGGVIMPARGDSWPSVEFDNPAPVTITYTAGWLTSELPSNVQHALLFYTRMSLDGLRGAEDPTRHASNLNTFEALVSGYRLTRWY